MDFEQIVRDQWNQIIDEEQTGSLSEYASNLTNGISDHFTIDRILDATLNGKSIFDSPELIDSLKQLFFYEMKTALVVGVEILGVCIVLGLLKNLSGSFGSKSTSDIASMTCCMVVIGLTMVNFHSVYTLTIDTVETITYTMEILLPILIGILIGMGQVTSGTIMSPLLLSTVTLFQTIIKNIILPAIFVSTVFTLLNCLTEKDYVHQLAKFIRNTALFTVGLLITLMSGMISIQGLITKTSDSLIIGTAKFSLDAFIPIVGGFTADTVELFLKCMGSIKNIVGLFGILIIAAFILIPIIKTVAVAVIYKITALVMEPIATKKISSGVSEIGTALITVAAVLFFSSLMFIIFITSIMNLGGG